MVFSSFVRSLHIVNTTVGLKESQKKACGGSYRVPRKIAMEKKPLKDASSTDAVIGGEREVKQQWRFSHQHLRSNPDVVSFGEE
ncbi:hypothetical protein U1Q18_038799 [Sarracenia purpurea var. burkii]